jgi:hypothetical protein
MYRRSYLTGGLRRAWVFLKVSNPDGFFSITESGCLSVGNLAHKSAESAVLTGDVFPVFPLPDR